MLPLVYFRCSIDHLIFEPENKYVLLFLLSFKFSALRLCESCDLMLFIYQDITQSKITCPVGIVTFHQRNFTCFSFVYLVWLGHMKWSSGIISFWYVFRRCLVVVCRVITWLHHVTCRNDSVSGLDGKGVRYHSHAPAHAVLKTQVRYVTRLKHYLVCFPNCSWFIHFLHS